MESPHFPHPKGQVDLKLILPEMCRVVGVVQRPVPEKEEENNVSKAGILKGTE